MNIRANAFICMFVLECSALAVAREVDANEALSIGVAEIDITPDYTVRLNGFGSRRTESEGVTQRIWAKALAFADEQQGPAILITADTLGVSDEIVQELATRLFSKIGLRRERLTVTATHTHTAPMLNGVSPTVFGVPIPPEHQANIDRYTEEFLGRLEQVALDSLKAIRPARVSWGVGTVGFAVNRRSKGGPVDHDLPVLFVTDLNGQVRAIYFSYACHCVTLSHNKISGDWAGYAQEALQKQFPGAIALASVGCGGDSNPRSGVSGDRVAACEDQGRQIADEIKRLFSLGLAPITAKPTISYARVDLPFDTPRTRAEWEERARSEQYAVAYHAWLNLSRLDRGEILPTKMTYPVQTWLFGDQLAIVFLPGETVVDYSLRLKREFDRSHLWVNGYANESRCYLPSERVLEEGGYEGGDAMIYYDRPQRFAPGVEKRIMDAVTAQLPESIVASMGTEGIRPLSPTESLRSIHTKPGLRIELVAAEPLVTSPVAIDWGPDGRLWVCEMFDYPAGLDGNYQPGGRVRFLEDTNHDGRYDKSTIFLEQLPFPTGVMAWDKGVLICAAPDILYAEDTNGDGKADKVEKLFSGFATENYQARVNGLSLGLDNWIYGANGLLSRTVVAGSNTVDIRNRDFRFQPLNGTFEPVSGLSQQGRVRDDWGRWFGCDNGSMLIHYPHEERYSRRNPNVPLPAPSVRPPGDFDVNRVYPISELLERFNDPEAANRVTSACGIGLYRDTLLGEEYYGNAFTCEPVHNLVHRMILDESGDQPKRRRAADEQQSEFLAATDNWFRPVQVRTGPDGALYVVDMYRFVVEHPRWIPAARLAKLDVRAGADKGRIYRVRPEGKSLRPIRDLKQLTAADLVVALDSPNGSERDRVHVELLARRDKHTFPALEHLALNATLPQVRVPSLCVLDGLGGLNAALLNKALTDGDARVRQQAIRLCEVFLQKGEERSAQLFAAALLSLTNDPSPVVLHQLALTLGEWKDARAGRALAHLARKHLSSSALRLAILSSAIPHCGDILDAIVNVDDGRSGRADWIPPLIATAAASGDDLLLAQALTAVLSPSTALSLPSRFDSLAGILDALARRQTPPHDYLAHPKLRDLEPHLAELLASARSIATDPSASERSREAAVKLLGRGAVSKDDLSLFCDLVSSSAAGKVRDAALAALRRQRNNDVASLLLERWKRISPAVRAEVVGVLATRDEWARTLLAAVKRGDVAPNEISLAGRQHLAQRANTEIRQLAAELFPTESGGSRADVLRKYEAVRTLSSDAGRGAEIFSKHCAACHLLNGIGHDVGPNLESLRSRDADYWIKNVLDPNAATEPRFINYEVELRNDRTVSGIIKTETANSLTVVAGSGVTETISREDVIGIRASTLSLMPEGIEEGITVQDMADLIAFLQGSGSSAVTNIAGDALPRDPESIARLILDPNLPAAVREAAIGANPQYASDLIVEMTRDLEAVTPEEYVRIPWIWRVAIACGKRDDTDEIKRVLAVSTPELDAPLLDWQAVVIGGGIINGLSIRGHWPAERLSQILAGDVPLQKRWRRALELAASMAEGEKVPAGTRYDALRMLGVEPWEKCGAQLVKYLAKSVNHELQQGAISGLSDVQSPQVAAALISGLSHYSKSNRDLALDALMRDEARIDALLDQVAAGRITETDLGENRLERLKDVKSERLAARIRSLLSK